MFSTHWIISADSVSVHVLRRQLTKQKTLFININIIHKIKNINLKISLENKFNIIIITEIISRKLFSSFNFAIQVYHVRKM